MSLESAIYSELTEHQGLSDLVADRVYPRQIPQDRALPAIAYTRVSTRDTSSMDCGDNSLIAARIQIDVVSDSDTGGYLKAKEVAKQVRVAMQNASSFHSVKQQDKDMPGFNPDYHRVMLEFNVWYREV